MLNEDFDRFHIVYYLSKLVKFLIFHSLTEEHLAILTNWFEDQETSKRMEGMLPLKNQIEFLEKSKNNFGFIVECNYKNIAFIEFEKENEVGYIALIINPKERGKGFCSKIITEFENSILSKQNLQKVIAYIEYDNFASINCFTKNGYTITGKDEDGLVEFSKNLK